MKTILNVLGFFFLCLAVLGIIVPVMPTTCFVLAAAACFARSSERFYQWLLASRLFGPMIHNWQTTRSMPRRAKIMAISTIIVSGAISMYLIDSSALEALVAGLLLIPIGIILKLPTSEALLEAHNQD